MKYSKKDHGDIAQGVKLIAALDWTTCQSCGVLDGNTWAWGDPNTPILPHHDGCRCSFVLWMKEPETLGLPKLNMKRMRASAAGPVPQDMNYSQWIKLYPAQ